jgi:hypothetical protein
MWLGQRLQWPFVWSKTADQILDTLAAYRQRINDSYTSVRCPGLAGQRFVITD